MAVAGQGFQEVNITKQQGFFPFFWEGARGLRDIVRYSTLWDLQRMEISGHYERVTIVDSPDLQSAGTTAGKESERRESAASAERADRCVILSDVRPLGVE